ncbi:MAG TPA: DUF6588 family protein [Ohtaekwangia sp.]
MNSKKIILLLCMTSLMFNAHAQNKITWFFPAAAVPTGGEENLHNLLQGYLKPIAEDFGTLSNNGWYTTSATHKRWGFDINVTVNNININSEAKTFDPVPLTGVTYLGGEDPLPTAYGKEGEFPQFQFTEGGNFGTTFRGPDGIDPGKDLPIGSLAVPTTQVGVGILKGTDLYVRFTPTIKMNATELGNWGVAIKHDIKQHIPVIADLPFSLSVFAGYTNLKATTDLSGHYNGNGQEGVAQTSSYTFQVLVGKEIKVISFYGGVGFNTSKTDYDINGTYMVNTTDTGGSLYQSVTLENPFSDSYSKSSLRGTAGLRLKFGPVILNGDYTLVSKSSIITAGFGFTFDPKGI